MQTILKNELRNIVKLPVRWDCPLADYTSFKIGGPAEALVVVEEETELHALLQLFSDEKVKWCTIGRGTNLLIPDDGFAGVVLVLGENFKGVKCREEDNGLISLQVGSAMGFTRLAKWCLARGLSGLEFAVGIPGTVGGAVIMNAGAWGHEIADTISCVNVVTVKGKRSFDKKELDFGYRCWHNHALTREPMVVTEVIMKLSYGERDAMEKLCSSYRQKRLKNQPQKMPNAGSIFKNPPHDSAGRLIEASGFKGLQVGGAQVSPVHANFIVNNGHATAADVLELIKVIQEKVQSDSNIDLEPEIHFL